MARSPFGSTFCTSALGFQLPTLPSRGEQASLPPPASFPPSGAWSWQARKLLPRPPCLCLRGTRQSFSRAETSSLTPATVPGRAARFAASGGQIQGSGNAAHSPSLPVAPGPRGSPAGLEPWLVRTEPPRRPSGPGTWDPHGAPLRPAVGLVATTWGPRRHQPPNSRIQRLHRWQHVFNPGFKDPIRGPSARDPRSCRIPALPPCIRARCPGVRCRRPGAQRHGTARLPAWCAGGTCAGPVASSAQACWCTALGEPAGVCLLTVCGRRQRDRGPGSHVEPQPRVRWRPREGPVGEREGGSRDATASPKVFLAHTSASGLWSGPKASGDS